MPKTRINAVTFDVGGTLITPEPSVGTVYAGIASQHGYSGLDAAELDRRFKSAWTGAEGFSHSREAWSRIVDTTFDGLLAPLPSETFFPQLYAAFAKREFWRVYDDVIPTLEELASRGIPMALVSNWDERLRPLLKSLKLSGYFETILISCEVYFAKPSNVIFDHVVRNLGLPAAEVLHVGDSEREDVLGARAAGLQSRLLRRGAPARAGQISSLTEIPQLVDQCVNDSVGD